MLANLSYTTDIWFCEHGGMVDALDLKTTDTYKKLYTYQALTLKTPLCVVTFVVTFLFASCKSSVNR